MKRPRPVHSAQLGLGFDDPETPHAAPSLPPAVTPAAAPSVAEPPSAPDTPAAIAASDAPDPAPTLHEQMARQIEAHPDFRVLRRLVPRLAFPVATGPVATLLVLDTETTGLNPARDKIVELALLRVTVDLASGQPVGAVTVYDGLEDPGMPMPEEARAITGITDEMLRGQRLDEAQVHRLLDGVDLVLAHNAGFDRPFVEARLPAFAALSWACSFADIDWKQEGRSSSKLSALALELGLFYDAHRAEMDCHALLAVLQAAQRDGATGLQRLIASAKSPAIRLLATGAPFDAKDSLKARGYRWDGAQKVWHTRLAGQPAFELECAWLKAEVFAGRSGRVQYEELDALTKYSTRPGQLGWREF